MKTVVIGGGPAGMLSAYFKSLSGSEVVLLEKNEKLGKKLYITGKGRCNVLNYCSEEEFLENVVSNPRFLSGAIRRFPPRDFKEFLEKRVPLKLERGNRVFPVSDKASDITKCLESYLSDAGVKIRLNERVIKVEKTGERFFVKTDKAELSADEVIICTGGKSYPLTGSTGDGYKFAEEFGHTVIPTCPALSGIETEEDFPSLQGVSLKNVKLSVFEDNKKIFEDFGEMLFTHYGISGPIVLTASSYINRKDFSKLKISIDLKPALGLEQLDERILRDFAKYKNKQVKNSLGDLLIRALIPVIIEKS
ncbi:MAG: aminoacetone oxidase family FAD-binding enzyme, partial [Clostridia bacterium]|nr:aminoacetone oxidase family FAD-binding enzyme [Clostridia bacterium]